MLTRQTVPPADPSAPPVPASSPRVSEPCPTSSPNWASTPSRVTPNHPPTCSAECRDAERIGLGSAFISERFNVKEAASLTGAAAAVTTELGVATGVTNHNTRHPLVTAAWATTMHRLSGGRFALGLGRGFDMLFDAIGLPRVTFAQLDDFVGPDAATLAGRDDLRPRRPRRQLPVPRTRLDLRRRHPDPAGRARSEVDGVRRPGDGRRHPAHVLHRRRARALRRARPARCRGGRTRSRVGAGLVGARRALRPTGGRFACGRSSVAWAPTSRATAISSCASTTGIRRCSTGSAPTMSSRPWAVRSMRRPTATSSSTSRR